MTLKERIRELCKSTQISMPNLESALGFGSGTISKWEKSIPSADKLQKVADYFEVTLDYLMKGNDSTTLNARDERDISRRLEQTLADLENQNTALMFDGTVIDDETRELLKASLENSITIAKINAKRKYTPNKYRTDN